MSAILATRYSTQFDSVHWPGTYAYGEDAFAFAVHTLQGRTRHLLVVTDPRVWQVAGPRVQQVLNDAGCTATLFEGVSANPSLDEVHAAVRAAKGCNGYIAVGGGSVIDITKVAYAATVSGEDPLMLLAPQSTWLASLSQPDDPVFLAFPTTAGTGSESSTAALIKDAQGRKLMFRSLRSRPQAVALVPEFTLGLPRSVTAAGGYDALLHALGALVNTHSSPLGDSIAAGALVRAMEAYPAVLERPDDLSARTAMMVASHLAGMAIALKRVDGVHGLCTPLEAYVQSAHAEVLSAVFDPVSRHAVQTVPAPYARAARLCGLAHPGGDDTAAALRLLDEVDRLRALGGLPDRLPMLYLDGEQYLAMADRALLSPSTLLHPRVLSRMDIVGLYRQIAGHLQR